MKKGLTELVFVLDRSGSMAGLEKDTIGGFNSMIKRQRKAEGEALVTTVLFDDAYEMIHQRENLKNIGPMTENVYYVRGCTALLDAVGRTISFMDRAQKKAPAWKQAEKVIFVITTDGMENASHQYNYSQVAELIAAHKKKGWEFLFLGANIDAIAEAGRMGIGEDRAVTYTNDSAGVALNYQVVGETVAAMRCCAAAVGPEWKKEIEEDRRRRGR